MRIQEILKSEQCYPLFTEVQAFTNEYLNEYVELIKTNKESSGLPFSSKDIFDFVWGSIEVSPEEVCLLDSPLLQRLRKIKQLGFTCMVYCNSDYSRFSHTLGVLEIAGRMARILSDNKNLEKPELLNFIHIVRIAALFHDAGHTFYSHVSETYFVKNRNGLFYENINQALTSFRLETGAPKTKLHEMLSVMIVNTESVKKLIELIENYFFINGGTLSKDTLNQVVEYISCLIIGIPCDRIILPYSSIINGPTDADKIDYLSRDSACTKVPIAVDVARLIQKITIVNLKAERFSAPPIWNPDYNGTNKPYQAMAIKYSARKACWQLSMARSIMYESVYCHHKKLSAETMFRNGYELFEQQISNSKYGKFESILSINDDFFNENTIDLFAQTINSSPELTKQLINTLKELRNRDLYKRVASFSLNTMYSEIYKKNQFPVIYSHFEDDIMLDKYSESQCKFFGELSTEVYNVAKILDRSLNCEHIQFAFIESSPTIDEQSEMDLILIEYGDGEYKIASEVFKGEPWMQGKENKQKEYFLISNLHERDLVYIALEKVIYNREEKYMLNSEAVTCAKYTKNDILKLKRELLHKGFYNNLTNLIPNEIVWDMLDKIKFDAVLEKYKNFQGKDGSIVDKASLFSYLRQFLHYTTKETVLRSIFDGVLRLISSAKYINRACFQIITSSLLTKVSSEYAGKNKYMIKIGGSRDSAASWSYYFNDIAEKSSYEYMEIETALELDQNNSVLVFFDDGAYSGSQVISIFQEMMGIPIEERTTNEKHGHVLKNEQREKLKKATIVLAYLFFTRKQKNILCHNLNLLVSIMLQSFTSKT